MHPFRSSITVNQLLLLTIILSSEAVKIGISKPLPITTTMSSSSTQEIMTDETVTENMSPTAGSTAATTETTTTKRYTTPESEWPEFPPKKNVNTANKTTTSEKPFTTTTRAITTTMRSTEDLSNTSITEKTETLVASAGTWPTKQEYCYCDLTKDSCDINCCCDPDCSAAILKVFDCLLATANDLVLRKTRFEDFKFQQGLPSCEVNDGWLCVFKTNKPVINNEASHILKDTSRFYKWPSLLLESEDIKSREFYKFGDLLRIINIETKEIQNFDLPSSFESSYCRIQEPIYHLKPTKRHCLISSYQDLKEIQLKLLHFAEKYRIFQAPIIPEGIYNTEHLHGLMGNISVYECLKNKRNCTRYKSIKENNTNYQLFKIKVNILHNFTNIQDVRLDLWLAELKEVQYPQEYWLSYEIEFFNRTLTLHNIAVNTATEYTAPISGPLGYLTGKPLIIARYEPFNKSQPLTTKNQIINYFSTNNIESHTLALPAKENGECKRSNDVKEFISYGINVAHYCKIKLENETILKEEPSNTNFTEICFNLQQRIHEQLFGQDLDIEELSSYYISQLGKPQNITHKWLQLQVYNTDFDSVVGQYLHESNTFICRNILLSLTYEFHMSNAMVDSVAFQNVLNYAVLHLAERHDLEFSLNENLEVPVTMTVRFYDIHEKIASAGYNITILIFFIILGLVINML